MLRLPSARTVVAVLSPRDAAEADGVARRLTALYRPVLGTRTRTRTHWDEGSRSLLAVVDDGTTGNGSLAGSLLWGLAVGGRGVATDAELTDAAGGGRAARDLAGRFLLVDTADDRRRLLTSAELGHVLETASGPAGTAWSTRGLAALVAARAPLRVRPERIPELLYADFVLLREHLLDGVRTLAEASVVDVFASGAHERSYFPAEERLAPGPPSTVAQVRDALIERLVRLAAVPRLQLGLSAGEDSTCVAACAAEGGLALDAMTIGGPGTYDGRGAAAAAARLGWRHRHVVEDERRAPTGRATVAALVERSRWTEGVDLGWNLVGGPLAWPDEPGVVLLSGSAAEIGRSALWPRRPPPFDPFEVALGGVLRWLPPAAGRAFRDRACADLDALRALRDSPDGVLDLLYATGRMHMWLHRQLPPEWVDETVPAFTDPTLVRLLLDLPLALRTSRLACREVQSLCRIAVGEVARAAVAAGPGPVSRVRDKVRRRLPRRFRPIDRGVRRLDALLARWPDRPHVVDEALGVQWWERVRAAAVERADARRWLWNAVAVEGLAAAVDGIGG